MSQNSNLLLLESCPHQASTLQITLASTFFFAKEKSALGRKDSDSSTSAKVGGAGLGRDHHEWGQWREEGSERLEGRQPRERVLREWELGKVPGQLAR